MSNEENSYYIIEFEDGMQLIPYNWFNASKSKAYWPNFTNMKKFDKAVQYMEPVGKNWLLYNVQKILGSAQSFESGKRKLKLAETQSDLNTDVSDEEKSKKERKVRAAKKLNSDTESDSQIIESVLKPFPQIKSYNKTVKTTKTIEDSKCENVQYIDNHYSASSSSSSVQSDNDILPSNIPTVSKSQKRDTITEVKMKNKKIIRKDNIIDKDFEEDDKEDSLFTDHRFQRFVIKNIVDTKLSLKRCENILTNILTRLEISNVSQKEDNYSASDILDDFPIKDSEMLQKVEHCLKTDESYKNSVIKTLSLVGGNDIKSITINILTRTLTNSVATEYSWIGGKKKLVFSNLYLWKIILSVVRRHIPDAIESEISKHIKIWLAHATERLQREERKNNNLELVSLETTQMVPTSLQIALEKDMIIAAE